MPTGSLINPIVYSHFSLPEPELSFHPNGKARHKHPLKGLIQYGPYSDSLVKQLYSKVRIATIGPNGAKAELSKLLAELESPLKPLFRQDYLIEYPGFSKVFKLPLLISDQAHIEFPASVDDEILNSDAPHLLLGEKLREAIQHLYNHRHEFDILMIYLPTQWAVGFTGPKGDEFDLHHYVKYLTSGLKIPTQLVRQDKAMSFECRCSVAWHLSIALYSKLAGGIPWKLADSVPDVAFVGISYALRKTEAGKTEFVTCCSQVFDANGSGLEFVAFQAKEYDLDGPAGKENPYLSRNEMRKVLSSCLNIYAERHSGRVPKQIFVHKSTEFTWDEIDGARDALGACENIELVRIQQDVSWKGVKIVAPSEPGQKRGIPAKFPVERGCYTAISENDVLLWTQGDAIGVGKWQSYYKEKAGIPSPIILTRYSGHGSLNYLCQSTLALTKMNWNSDSLYDRLPVTLNFASTLADNIKRMPDLSPGPHEFRFFI